MARPAAVPENGEEMHRSQTGGESAAAVSPKQLRETLIPGTQVIA
jgi:hypothetical protein